MEGAHAQRHAKAGQDILSSMQANASRQPFSRGAMVLGPVKKQALPNYPVELDTKARGVG